MLTLRKKLIRQKEGPAPLAFKRISNISFKSNNFIN